LIFWFTKEATSNSKAKQADVEAMAKEVKLGWWANNKYRFTM